MKKFASIVIALTFVFGTIANANAQDVDCGAYDVVGITTGGNGAPWSFAPDGWVTFNRTNWWEDDVYACYNTYRYPQYYQYFAACDYNSDGTVAWEEVLDVYYFVTQYPWTNGGATHAYQCPVIPDEECENLAGVDFMAEPGMPQPLGAGYIDGECTTIFGTGVPAGVFIFANVADCNAECGGCSTNADCASGEYCLFEEYTCGSAGLGTCEPAAEMCYQVYEPVCDCNGNTRSNNCTVAQDWTNVGGLPAASIAYVGECQ